MIQQQPFCGNGKYSEVSWPRVSIVLPVLNEEPYIEACLRSIMQQHYPADRMEIIVVDGMSTDRTREVVLRLQTEDSRIQILDSPKRRAPFSMNVGIRAATGDVLVRIDGHSVVESEHVQRCVEYLLRSGADHVGGISRATGDMPAARAIALALSSPFGVGSARFRYTTREAAVDTVPFGAYRMETLRKLAGFDERFLVASDSELDFRIIRSGGQVRVTPDIRTTYFCRRTFGRLARQYFNYGRYRARTVHKHRSFPTLRVLAPASLVASAGLLLLLAPFSRRARRTLPRYALAYAACNLVVSLSIAARRGWRHALLLPVSFLTLHLSHGSGFLTGLSVFLTSSAGREMNSVYVSAWQRASSVDFDEEERTHELPAPSMRSS